MLSFFFFLKKKIVIGERKNPINDINEFHDKISIQVTFIRQSFVLPTTGVVVPIMFPAAIGSFQLVHSVQFITEYTHFLLFMSLCN